MRTRYNAPAIIREVYPNVTWTGESDQHLSFYRQMPVPTAKAGPLLRALYKYQVPKQIWDLLHKHFGEGEWLMNERQFTKLFFVDVHRKLMGEETFHTSKRIKNPRTGNKFHRMTINKDVIGGIRFWADGYAGSDYDEDGNEIESQGHGTVGFRHRFVYVASLAEQDAARAEAAETISTIDEEMEKITEEILTATPGDNEALVRLKPLEE